MRDVQTGSDAELTRQNRSVLEMVAQALIVDNDIQAFGDLISDERFVQHGPVATEDKAAALALEDEIMARRAGLVGRVHKIIVDGDVGAVHSYFRPAGNEPGGMVYMDIFRLLNGRIIERRNVMQPWPLEAANDHPMI